MIELNKKRKNISKKLQNSVFITKILSFLQIDKKEVKYDVTKEEAKEAYDLLNKSINRNQTYYWCTI